MTSKKFYLEEQKLIEDIIDCCEYGPQVLNEETGKEYLKFIVDALHKFLNKYGIKRAQLDANQYGINRYRFEDEIKRGEKPEEPDIKNDYFEGKSIEEFKNDFQKVFTQLKTQYDKNGKTQVNATWVSLIQSCFNNYVKSFQTSTKFKNGANWKNKDK